jgi:hypothetical protein
MLDFGQTGACAGCGLACGGVYVPQGRPTEMALTRLWPFGNKFSIVVNPI